MAIIVTARLLACPNSLVSPCLVQTIGRAVRLNHLTGLSDDLQQFGDFRPLPQPARIIFRVTQPPIQSPVQYVFVQGAVP